MNRKELLAAIRKIVGRKFQFSEAYAKKCADIFDKIKNSEEDMEKITNQ